MPNSYTELQNENYSDIPVSKCYLPKRYIFVFMGFLGFVLSYSSKTILSVAIVPMTGGGFVSYNTTSKALKADVNWDLQLQGLLLSIPYYGGIVAQIPLSWLSHKYGGKYLFGCGQLLTGITLLLTPVTAQWSVSVFIVLRFFQGFGEGSTYSCMMELLSKWIPSQEKSKLSGFIFSGAYVGNVISLPIGGLLASSQARWPSIFYFFGGLEVCWFVFWMYLITEKPSEHTSISREEQIYIEDNLGWMCKSENPPYGKIFCSAPVWAIGIGFFVENWGIFTWIAELPTYLDDIYNTDIKKIGFLSPLPYLLLTVTSALGGPFADCMRNRGISTTTVRKFFTCGAYVLQIIFIMWACYSQTIVQFVIALSMGIGIGGFAIAGTGVNALDLAPQYSSLVMGFANTMACLPGILSPTLTGYIVEKGDDQWKWVFYISVGFYFIGAVLFCLMSSGERQKWADNPDESVT
ncbi:hypothetical protein LOTGIDRAFT_161078 [Lottia gigantea]|uniref:Major facilitator superfamily (MFS) profile domain-containing protein n=1 Tax=Lottia gigantea TaxID=225164 RepID=V4AMI2_LOTGI|nr:hypothetical protein LOTGIDRAFT_161078 [Lottia gigantea]ESO94826.1 hypothetical protein LOTGIDRAFT_161078 [Lottia gigantea]